MGYGFKNHTPFYLKLRKLTSAGVFYLTLWSKSINLFHVLNESVFVRYCII